VRAELDQLEEREMTKKYNTKKHNEAPSVVSVERKAQPAATITPPACATPSELARLRAASRAFEQRQDRSRLAALAYIEAAEQPAPLLHDDLQAVRRRPLAAPMATPKRRLPQDPAIVNTPYGPINTTASVLVTATSIALVLLCLTLAAWWGN